MLTLGKKAENQLIKHIFQNIISSYLKNQQAKYIQSIYCLVHTKYSRPLNKVILL